MEEVRREGRGEERGRSLTPLHTLHICKRRCRAGTRDSPS